jgi:hypothetical protein
MVTQDFWEPAEQVLVSSPPGFLVRGSIVYCKKRPSADHILGLQFDAPVDHWIETLPVFPGTSRESRARQGAGLHGISK